MKSVLRTVLWAALLSTSLVALVWGAGPLAVGQLAPTFSLKDANGKTFDLASHRGKRSLILVFYRGYF